MNYFVYVIYASRLNIYYKGFTEDVSRRLFEHNNDLSRYTAGKGPWQLIIVEQFETKKDAIVRERKLKRCKSEYFEWLRKQHTNLASLFIESN